MNSRADPISLPIPTPSWLETHEEPFVVIDGRLLMTESVRRLQADDASGFGQMIGASPAFNALLAQLADAAELHPVHGVDPSGRQAEHCLHPGPAPTPPVNTPLPTPPEPASSREADLARLQAWQELHRQMMELHAQLEYASLLLRLGLRAR